MTELLAHASVNHLSPSYDAVRRKPSFQFTAVPQEALKRAVQPIVQEEDVRMGLRRPGAAKKILLLKGEGAKGRGWINGVFYDLWLVKFYFNRLVVYYFNPGCDSR